LKKCASMNEIKLINIIILLIKYTKNNSKSKQKK
jgi:hypothetical protein